MIVFCLFLFQAVAFAAGSPWPDVSSAPKGEKADGSKDAALIVSIEDYAFVSDIEGAQQNGRDWYQWVTKSQGISVGNVALIENEKATKEAILKEAKRLSESAAGGKLWFVFIGHGAPAPNGKDGLLLGSDVQQTADSLGARGVSQEELIDTLEAKGASVVAVIDACFSGQSSDGETLVEGLQPLIATTDLNVGSSVVLSAAKHDEFAGPLPGLDRPAFSYLALGALRGWGDLDSSGSISPDEVVEYSKDALLGVLYGRTQTPNLRGATEGVALSKGIEAGPDLAAIRYELTPVSKDIYKLGGAVAKGSMLTSIAAMATGLVIWQVAAEVHKSEPDRFQSLKTTGDVFFVTGFTLLPSGAALYAGVKVAQKMKDSKEKK